MALVTTKVVCEYFDELFAVDEVIIRMVLLGMQQNRVTMGFEYWRNTAGTEQLVARGEQQIACMRHSEGHFVPTPVPAMLQAALQAYV
ncbi:MAG TPA: thioesterase family protein [Herpetosiphonaceae bacterium]